MCDGVASQYLYIPFCTLVASHLGELARLGDMTWKVGGARGNVSPGCSRFTRCQLLGIYVIVSLVFKRPGVVPSLLWPPYCSRFPSQASFVLLASRCSLVNTFPVEVKKECRMTELR
jgi:hypothetical protein